MDYNKPLILIIDFDGTIGGNISPQIMYYDLLTGLKRVNKNIKINNQPFIKKGIVRPHFAEFCRIVSKLYPNIEIFIYTASEGRWANFIVSKIEKSIKYKFRRPLFTRDDCILVNNDFHKDVDKIIPRIKKSLNKKWGSFTINNNLLIIDNNNVYPQSQKPYLLMCPTYDYKYLENIPQYIDYDTFIKHHKTICDILSKYYSIKYTDDYFEFQLNFYKYYINYLSHLEKSNKKFLDDKFWFYLYKILIKKNFTRWGTEQILYIKKKMYHKYTKKSFAAVTKN